MNYGLIHHVSPKGTEMALFPVIDGQVQFDLSVPSGSIYINGLRFNTEGAVYATDAGSVLSYVQGLPLSADGALVVSSTATGTAVSQGLQRDIATGGLVVSSGDVVAWANGLPRTALGGLAT